MIFLLKKFFPIFFPVLTISLILHEDMSIFSAYETAFLKLIYYSPQKQVPELRNLYLFILKYCFIFVKTRN